MKFGVDFVGVAVVFYCHDGEGNVFLSKRGGKSKNELGRWDIGGGKLEFGERAEDAVVREIKEEYLTDVVEQEFLGYRDVFVEYEGKGNHWIALDFKVRVERDKAGNGEPHKFDEVGWFAESSFPAPLHSQLPAFLSKYANRLYNKGS
ncbi:MAG: hypothetical protein RIQ56_273 [Candidatus Parcubacteria bacterium]|jgi:ADP-ribose pyrophosphatase YjhB (NUDIX family)